MATMCTACMSVLFFFYSPLRTFPERGGRPLSPPGPDSLGGPLCHSAAPGTHRCPVPSLLRPWWCRQWETQWLQVSGLVATKGGRLSVLTITINNNIYFTWAKQSLSFSNFQINKLFTRTVTYVWHWQRIITGPVLPGCVLGSKVKTNRTRKQ